MDSIDDRTTRIKGLSRFELLQAAREKAALLEKQPLPFADAAFLICCVALSGHEFAALYPNRMHSPEPEDRTLASYFFGKYRKAPLLVNGSAIDVERALGDMGQSFWQGLEQVIEGLAVSGRSLGSLRSGLGLSARESLKATEIIFLECVTKAFLDQFGTPRDYVFKPRIGGVVPLGPR